MCTCGETTPGYISLCTNDAWKCPGSRVMSRTAEPSDFSEAMGAKPATAASATRRSAVSVLIKFVSPAARYSGCERRKKCTLAAVCRQAARGGQGLWWHGAADEDRSIFGQATSCIYPEQGLEIREISAGRRRQKGPQLH